MILKPVHKYHKPTSDIYRNELAHFLDTLLHLLTINKKTPHHQAEFSH